MIDPLPNTMIPFSREREREIGFLDSSLRKQRETERNEREREMRGGNLREEDTQASV